MPPRPLIACLMLAVACATATEASAAFIPPHLAASDRKDIGFDGTAGSDHGSLTARPHDLQTPTTPGQPGSAFYAHTGRGMTSGSTTVPTGVGAAGIAASPGETQLAGEQLVTRWGREGRCDLPPSHMEGVFRPPRTDAK